jgi:CheY-like chemotaxis protein
MAQYQRMKTEKILIVDDEPNMRFFLSEALRKQGYACDEAGDGQQALERMADAGPDIVILDLKMPRMGGMEALRKIRVLDPEVAVIIVTAFGSREIAYRALEEAYDHFTGLSILRGATVVGRAAERVCLWRAVRSFQIKVEDAYAPEKFQFTKGAAAESFAQACNHRKHGAYHR